MSEPVTCYFSGGPLDGQTRRLLPAEETVIVHAHRQARGVVEVGDGGYGGRSEKLWEPHRYERTEHEASWAEYQYRPERTFGGER